MQRVAGLLLGLLGTTRTYSNPVKRLVEMTVEVFTCAFIRLRRKMGQSPPLPTRNYSDLLLPARPRRPGNLAGPAGPSYQS